MSSKLLKIVTLSVVASSIVSVFLMTLIFNNQTEANQDEVKTTNELLRDYYATETEVHVSPHGLRKAISKGYDDFIIVDVRSQEEYEKEHIIGAINIPAYKDPDTTAYDDVERIVNEFKKLDMSKDIILYCYSGPCMTGRKVGKMLADEGIYVKQLGVGWNEWRYFWNLWNHEHEWDITNVEDYIATGSEPGKYEVKEGDESGLCPIEGGLGC